MKKINTGTSFNLAKKWNSSMPTTSSTLRDSLFQVVGQDGSRLLLVGKSTKGEGIISFS